LRRGSYIPIAADGDLLLYIRSFGSERTLIALNLGPEPATIMAAELGGLTGTVLASTSGGREGDRIDASFRLDADEGLVISLAPEAGRLRSINFSHGTEWKALISRYMRIIPPGGDACCMAAQRVSDSPPVRAVSSAMTAKVGVAARQSQPATARPANRASFPNDRLVQVGRDVVKISDTAVAQRPPVPRSSE
jgi:hypothetical protein